MAISNSSSSSEPRPEASGKKTYEKPTFRFEEVFVTSALSCGKISSTQSSCTGATSAS
jgi:hypothetical protein